MHAYHRTQLHNTPCAIAASPIAIAGCLPATTATCALSHARLNAVQQPPVAATLPANAIEPDAMDEAVHELRHLVGEFLLFYKDPVRSDILQSLRRYLDEQDQCTAAQPAYVSAGSPTHRETTCESISVSANSEHHLSTRTNLSVSRPKARSLKPLHVSSSHTLAPAVATSSLPIRSHPTTEEAAPTSEKPHLTHNNQTAHPGYQRAEEDQRQHNKCPPTPKRLSYNGSSEGPRKRARTSCPSPNHSPLSSSAQNVCTIFASIRDQAYEYMGACIKSKQRENINNQVVSMANGLFGIENSRRIVELAHTLPEQNLYATPPASPRPLSRPNGAHDLGLVVAALSQCPSTSAPYAQHSCKPLCDHHTTTGSQPGLGQESRGKLSPSSLPLIPLPRSHNMDFPYLPQETLEQVALSSWNYASLPVDDTNFTPHRAMVAAACLFSKIKVFKCTDNCPDRDRIIHEANLCDFHRIYKRLCYDVAREHTQTRAYILSLGYESGVGRTWITLVNDCLIRHIVRSSDMTSPKALQTRTSLKNAIALGQKFSALEERFTKGILYMLPTKWTHRYVLVTASP